jgi:hypothetical protein
MSAKQREIERAGAEVARRTWSLQQPRTAGGSQAVGPHARPGAPE